MGTVSEDPLPECENDEELANRFANFFVDKIQKIRDDLDSYPLYDRPVCDMTFDMDAFYEIDGNMVKKVITKLQMKSCELDIIPTYILKDNIEKFLPKVMKIVNLSLAEEKFDQSWKTAILKPLLKKKGLDLINSNYHPVSNLSFISKIVESVAMGQFNHHYEINNIAPQHKSPYCEHHSCETALTKVMDEIHWNTEQKKVTVLFCLDLNAAFDMVDHSVLIKVLNKYYGISGSALQWFESYLADRLMKVSIGDVYLETKRLSFSVPQGSCGGPVLYCAHASMILEIIPKLINLHTFTDDHAISDNFNPSIATSELDSAM